MLRRARSAASWTQTPDDRRVPEAARAEGRTPGVIDAIKSPSGVRGRGEGAWNHWQD